MARIPERDQVFRAKDLRVEVVILAADKGQEQRYLRSCIRCPCCMGIGIEHCGEQKPSEASIGEVSYLP